MEHATATMDGVGGTRLYTQAWLPAEATSVVVLVHGLGEHSSRYGHVAAALVEDGHAVHTLDHRGHGRSEGRRVQVERFDELLEDLHSFVSSVRGRHPGLPLFVVGHSMGGLVAVAYAQAHPEGIAGLVVSGMPSLPPNISGMTIAVGRAVARVVPHVGVASLPLRKVSRDPDVVRAYFDDPLITKSRVRARMGAELLDAIARADAAAPAMVLPVLILHGGDDAIAPAEAGRRLHERIGSPDKKLVVYDGLWHEIFNEPERERVIGDLREWLRAHR